MRNNMISSPFLTQHSGIRCVKGCFALGKVSLSKKKKISKDVFVRYVKVRLRAEIEVRNGRY